MNRYYNHLFPRIFSLPPLRDGSTYTPLRLDFHDIVEGNKEPTPRRHSVIHSRVPEGVVYHRIDPTAAPTEKPKFDDKALDILAERSGKSIRELKTIITPNRALAEKIPLEWIEKALERKGLAVVIYGCKDGNWSKRLKGYYNDGECHLESACWIERTRSWFSGVDKMPEGYWEKLWLRSPNGFSEKLDDELKALGIQREQANRNEKKMKQLQQLHKVFSPELAAVFLADVAGFDVLSRDRFITIGQTYLIGIGEEYSSLYARYQELLAEKNLSTLSIYKFFNAATSVKRIFNGAVPSEARGFHSFYILDDPELGLEEFLRSAIQHVYKDFDQKVFLSIPEASGYLFRRLRDYCKTQNKTLITWKGERSELIRRLGQSFQELLQADLQLAQTLPIEAVRKWLADRIEQRGFLMQKHDSCSKYLPHDFIHHLEASLSGPDQAAPFARYYPPLWTLKPLEILGMSIFLSSWNKLRKSQRTALEAFQKLGLEDQKEIILQYDSVEKIISLRDEHGEQEQVNQEVSMIKNYRHIVEFLQDPDTFFKENGRILPFQVDVDLVNIITDWGQKQHLDSESSKLKNQLVHWLQSKLEDHFIQHPDHLIDNLRVTKGVWCFRSDHPPGSTFLSEVKNDVSKKKIPHFTDEEVALHLDEALSMIKKRYNFLSDEEFRAFTNVYQKSPSENILNAFLNLKLWEYINHSVAEDDPLSEPNFTRQTAFLIEPSGDNMLLEAVEVIISPQGRFEGMNQPVDLYDKAENLLKSALGSVPEFFEGPQGAAYVLSLENWEKILEEAKKNIQEEKNIQERSWWIIPRHLGQSIPDESSQDKGKEKSSEKLKQPFFGLHSIKATERFKETAKQPMIEEFGIRAGNTESAALFNIDIGMHLLNRCAETGKRLHQKMLLESKELLFQGGCWPQVSIPDDLPPLKSTHNITPMGYQIQEVRLLQAFEQTAKRVTGTSTDIIRKIGRIVAFQMGLGKTLVAFHISSAPSKRSLLIVPKSTMQQTQSRFSEWGAKVYGCDDTEKLSTALRALCLNQEGVIVTTLGALQNSQNQILVKEIPFDVVIVDEAQSYHSGHSNSSRFLRKLLEDQSQALPVMLTGTPYGNRLSDLGQLLSYVNQTYPNNLGDSLQRIRNTAEQKLTSFTKDGSKKDGVSSILHGFFTQWALTRHLKACMTLLETGDSRVQGDLKEKKIPIPQRQEVEKIDVTLTDAQKNRIEDIKPKNWEGQRKAVSTSGAENGGLFKVKGMVSRAMVHPDLAHFDKSEEAIEYLKSVSIDAGWVRKSRYLKALIDSSDFRDHVIEGDEPAVIFVSDLASGIVIQKGIQALYGREVDFLDGRSRAKGRQEMVENFGVGKNPVLIVGIKAGGAGLDLKQGKRAYLADAEYNPSHTEQAIFRILRLGSEGRRKIFRIDCGTWIDRHVNQIKAIKKAEDKLIRDWVRSEAPVGVITWQNKFEEYLEMLFLESNFTQEQMEVAMEKLKRALSESLPGYLQKLEESSPIDSTWVVSPAIETRKSEKRLRSRGEGPSEVKPRPVKKQRQFEPSVVITTKSGTRVPKYQPIWITPDGKVTNFIRIPLPFGTHKSTAAKLCRWMGDERFAESTSALYARLLRGGKASDIFEGEHSPYTRYFFEAIEKLIKDRALEEFLGSTILKVMSGKNGHYMDEETVEGVRYHKRSPGRVYLVQHEVDGNIFYEALVDRVALKGNKRKRGHSGI